MANNCYWVTNLTGGGVGALDNIDGASLSDNDTALYLANSYHLLYVLEASSGASESSPRIISPDSNAGDKRWLLKSLNSSLLSYLTKTQADSPYTVLAINLLGNVIHDNSGASGECIFQLPAGFESAIFRLEVKAAQYAQVKAYTGEVLTYGGSDTASNGYFRNNDLGGLLECRWNGAKWNVFNVIGYWRKDS
jgi:hypothetical protein